MKLFQKENIKLLLWQPYSPNLNIMDILAILSEIVYKKAQFRSMDELWKVILEATSNVPIQTVQSLYDSIIPNILKYVRINGNLI